MSTTPTPNLYRILLLTIWQEDEETWRFLLEDPRSGERKGYAELDLLVEGLKQVIGNSQTALNNDTIFDSASSPEC